MKTLQTIQNDLRGFVPQGTETTIAELKKLLKPGTQKHNDLILLESRHEEVNRKLLQGIVSQEDATLEYNNIRKDLLNFINDLNESDLAGMSQTTGDAGFPDVYNGEVLYRIPKKMQLGIEEECTVRIAFDRKKLLENFEVEVGDIMKDLQISNVMGVELLDQGHAFQITTVYDTVQKIEHNLVTEWVFCVTPLKEGEFPLILKISIIEIEEGIERKRNVVLKEKVEILTQKPEAFVPDFVSAGYTWQSVDTVTQRAAPGGGKGIESPSPALPNAPSPHLPTTQPSNASKAVGLSLIGKLIAGVATILVGGLAIDKLLDATQAPSPEQMVAIEKAAKIKRLRANPNRSDLEEFVKQYPIGTETETALAVLDSLEDAIWNSAIASNDEAAMTNYLEQYPDGAYAPKAASRLDEINRGKMATVDTAIVVIADSVKKEVQIEPGSENPLVSPTPPARPPRPRPRPRPQPQPTPRPTPQPPVNPPHPTPPNPRPPGPTPVVDPDAKVPFKLADRKPVFKKCDNSDKKKEERCTVEKVRSYLEKKFEAYPQEAQDNFIEGIVVVSFVVEKDGSVTDVKALNDIGGGCAEAAVKMVKSLPKFKPGLNKKGDPIRVQYTQPVRFKIN
jgi:TonB family protein